MNIIVNLRDMESTQDVVARAKEYRVVISSQTAFARFLRKNQGVIVVTFALPADIVKEGVERLKASLL